MYTEFNRKNLGDLRGQLTDVLNKFGKEVGIRFEIDGGIAMDYSQASAYIKLEGTIEGTQNRRERDLEMYTDYKVGDTYVSNRGTSNASEETGTIVVGYEPKNRSYPLIIRKPNGKEYKTRYIMQLRGTGTGA